MASSSESSSSQISYLRARDPMINEFYKLSGVKVNLAEEEFNASESDRDDEHMQVYLRIKKIENNEGIYKILDKKTLLCKAPKEAQCMKNIRRENSVIRFYKFSNIFGPDENQNYIFNMTIKKKMLEFINGHNCNLLTYGTSGSGKTFTLLGTNDKPGIIPRALEYLFKTLPKLSEFPIIKPIDSGDIIWLRNRSNDRERCELKNILKSFKSDENALHIKTYEDMQQRLKEESVASITDDSSDLKLSVWVSFAEIYNEQIHDLLLESSRGQTQKKLRLVQSKSQCYIKDLSCVNVTSGLEAYQVLQYGLKNLNYASTMLNNHSSRSHAIFTIKLVQASKKHERVTISKLNFCDLAGSERANKTQNAGQRLQESKNINSSLLVLGRCIGLVRKLQIKNERLVIPFRESKLTQFFQNALLGHEAISMIVNISPEKRIFDETQCTLDFAAVAKDIQIDAEPVKVIKSRFSLHIKDKNVYDEVEDVCDLLENQLRELNKQYEDLRNNVAADRERVISTYKNIRQDTMEFYETKYHELLMNRTPVPVPVVYVSDESLEFLNSDDCIDTNGNGSTVSDNDKATMQLQEELICLRSEMAIIEEQYKNELNGNKLLKRTLQDAKRINNSLAEKYENDVEQYSAVISTQEDNMRKLNFDIAVLKGLKDIAR